MKSVNNKKFLVVDDHNVVRKGMIVLIKNEFTNATIHSAEKLDEIFPVLEKTNIDLIILDINFPTGNSLNTIKEIKILKPDIKILIFSAYDEDVYAVRYLSAGASGFLNKGSSEEEMKDALRIMLLSGKYTSQNLKNKILDSYISKTPMNPIERLSNREIEVAKHLINGQGNLEISAILKIERTTVSTYKNRIFEKLEIDNLALLIEIFQLYSDDIE
jgi:DNA-binding NarL/FixJ family response regulator